MMRYVMCALMMSATLEAAAQESQGAVYVTAGVSFPHQAAPEAGSPPPFAAPGGNTVGWLVGGASLFRRVSLSKSKRRARA